MADSSTTRLPQLVDSLRAPPGSRVSLEDDHDPAFKAGWLKKKDGAEHLKLSTELLAEYQNRLAAEASQGYWSCCKVSTPPARTGRSAT